MAIKWILKKYIKDKHSIDTAKTFKEKINKKTGVSVSLQNVCNLLSKSPNMIRLETMQILCDALDCRLSDFIEITPSKKNKLIERKLSYKNTPLSKRGLETFPDPKEYQS